MEHHVRFRQNRFPKLVVESKCKTIKKIGEYECGEVQTYKLALERGDCSNGVYDWNIGIEKIPSNCICIKNKISIIGTTV